MPRRLTDAMLAKVTTIPGVFDGSLDSMAALVQSPGESRAYARSRMMDLLGGEPDMEKFVEVYRKCEKKKKLKEAHAVNLDECAAAAGVNRSEAFGAMCRVLHRYAFDISRVTTALVCAANASRVARALCANAGELDSADSARDRQTFFQLTGQLRSGGGVAVNVPVHVEANAAAGAKAGEEEATGGLPAFEQEMKEVGSMMRLLDAPGGR